MTNLQLAQDLFHKLKSRVPKASGVHEPLFDGKEWDYVKECIDTAWVSSGGKYVDLFETRLAEYTGSRFAIVVVNGTAALHTCLILSDVREGDEVLIPTLTFVATANAVTYTGAIPHFVDSEATSLGVDPIKLNDYLSSISEKRGRETYNKKTGRRIRALMPMHTYGHPVQIEPLLEICDHYGLIFIEDAAESIGSYYKDRHTGLFGKVSAMSFNGNKTITTGGGGAILTQDPSIAERAKHLTTTAKKKMKIDFFEHDEVGYNYRMPNINAALGCAQIEQLPAFLEKKRALAHDFERLFAGMEDVRFLKEPSYAKSNYWLNIVLLKRAQREFLEVSNENGIATRPVWTLLHQLPMYSSCPRMDLSTAEEVSQQIICLPSSAWL